MENVDGKIAAILSRTRVVINLGSKDGVEQDDDFLIYTQLGPFYDPDTKANLGTTTEVWGRVTVTTVEGRFCIAETGYRNKYPFLNNILLNSVFGMGSEQIKLPVREDQIQGTSLIKIQVGFLVRLVKKDRLKALEERTEKALSLTEGDIDKKDDSSLSQNIESEIIDIKVEETE